MILLIQSVKKKYYSIFDLKIYLVILYKSCTFVYMSEKITIIDGKKLCSICKETLPIKNFTKNARASCGLNFRCKSCASEMYLGKKKEFATNSRKNHLLRTFGMTLSDYDKMLESQGNVCAICKEPETSKNRSLNVRFLSVDHCHNSGKIRGLLCHRCNHLLGMSTDNIDILQEAIDYLKIHKNE